MPDEIPVLELPSGTVRSLPSSSSGTAPHRTAPNLILRLAWQNSGPRLEVTGDPPFLPRIQITPATALMASYKNLNLDQSEEVTVKPVVVVVEEKVTVKPVVVVEEEVTVKPDC